MVFAYLYGVFLGLIKYSFPTFKTMNLALITSKSKC